MAKTRTSKLGGADGSKVVSLRLADEDHAVFLAKVEASGLTRSEFFRDCVLANRTEVVARPKSSVDAQRVLYAVNKAGNNLNQLAHRANVDHAAGKVDQRTYSDVLYQLRRIAQYMQVMVNHVD